MKENPYAPPKETAEKAALPSTPISLSVVIGNGFLATVAGVLVVALVVVIYAIIVSRYYVAADQWILVYTFPLGIAVGIWHAISLALSKNWQVLRRRGIGSSCAAILVALASWLILLAMGYDVAMGYRPY